MLPAAVVLIAAALVGGILPVFVRRSDRLFHVFIALATGILLGVVFLDLLPHVAEMAHVDVEEGAHGHGILLWFCVLLGVAVLYLLERLVLRRQGESEHLQHVTVSYATFLGLGVHSLTAGLALAALDSAPESSGALLVSLALHKAAEAFSLATVFLLAGFPRKRIVVLLMAFSIVTPLGLALGEALVQIVSPTGVQVLTALATGTFLFVALGSLLPEVFHRREDVALKVALLGIGIAVGALAHELVA